MGSFFFGILALILFAVVFFMLTGNFNSREDNSPEPGQPMESPKAGLSQNPDQPHKETETRNIFFVIQVGSFPNFEEAKYYSEKFRLMGYPVEISSPDPADAIPMFQVSIGRFDSLDAAEVKMTELEKKENLKFTIKMRY